MEGSRQHIQKKGNVLCCVIRFMKDGWRQAEKATTQTLEYRRMGQGAEKEFGLNFQFPAIGREIWPNLVAGGRRIKFCLSYLQHPKGLSKMSYSSDCPNRSRGPRESNYDRFLNR